MAANLVRAGYPVSVWNRTAAKMTSLQALGAVACSSPAQAAESADIVIFMMENGAVVAEVLTHAIAALSPAALVIDMSSTSQSEALALHATLAQRAIAALDAPVSGGVIGAQTATLAIMVGGASDCFLRAQPVLEKLGRVTLVGGPGAGQVAKLCNQLIVGATLNIVAEALLLAQSAGADPAAVRRALRGGFAESRILEVHGQRMLERDFRPGGQIKSQSKDLDNVLQAAADAGLQLPIAALVREQFHCLLGAVPTADQSAILLAVEQANPGCRLGDIPDRLP